MSGILEPLKAYSLIRALKETISIPIILHSHCTGGLAYMAYLKAIEAGVDVLDTAISCFSGGTSQPSTEAIYHVAKTYGISFELNAGCLKRINGYFSGIIKEYYDKRLLRLNSLITDPGILESQIPGGMYSNLLSQLEDIECIDRIDDVVKEIPIVRRDLGYPPLVTPVSQMVGTQAVTNVLSEARYYNLCNEVKSYLNGEYGSAPGEINPILLSCNKREGDGMFSKYGKAQLDEGFDSECDELTCLLFPQVGGVFIKSRDKGGALPDNPALDNVNGASDLLTEPDFDQFIDFNMDNGDSHPIHKIRAGLPGTIIRIFKAEGDAVSEGEPLLIYESMKMENEIFSPTNGTLSEIHVRIGDKVKIRQDMMVISGD